MSRDQTYRIPVSRREFLARIAAVTAVAMGPLAGCTKDTATRLASGGGAPTDSDLSTATHLAGLEVVAMHTYEIGADAIKSRLLGRLVPFGVIEYVGTGITHHRAHLDAWNQFLTKADRPRVTKPNRKLKSRVDKRLTEVDDLAKALYLMDMLEDTLAQTYLKVIPTLHSEHAVRTAAAIQVVDQQHLTILRYVLGQYPIPNAFQDSDKALLD